jgi:hypothetical protein
MVLASAVLSRVRLDRCMMTMHDDIMRTIVDIPEADLERLSGICKVEGISRAEAVRRAVRLYLERQAASEKDVFGIWKDRDIDALEYERSLREEWK